MSESAESVKLAVELLRRSATSLREKQPKMASDRDQMADALEALVADHARLMGLTRALPPDLGNIFELPAELREELSVAKTDETEDQIVTAINAYGGTATLDQILVGIYKKFGTIQKRRFVQNKLYRMDMVWAVDGRKGVYTTVKPDYEVLAKAMMEEPEAPTSTITSDDKMPWDDDPPF